MNKEFPDQPTDDELEQPGLPQSDQESASEDLLASAREIVAMVRAFFQPHFAADDISEFDFVPIPWEAEAIAARLPQRKKALKYWSERLTEMLNKGVITLEFSVASHDSDQISQLTDEFTTQLAAVYPEVTLVQTLNDEQIERYELKKLGQTRYTRTYRLEIGSKT